MNYQIRIGFVMVLTICGQGVSHGQSADSACTALLQNGVFDQTNKTEVFTSYSHVRNELCSNTYSEAKEGKSRAIQAGLPIDGLLVPFGYKQDDASYASSRTAFCSQAENDLYVSDNMILAVRKADAALAEQFNSCISKLSAGFEYYINAGADPNTFQVKTIYRQGIDKVYPIVKKLSIRPDEVASTCDQGRAFNPGQRLGLDESFTCTRIPNQGVTVSLSTNIATTSGPAILRPYRNEHIVRDEKIYSSVTQRFASKDKNGFGLPVCVDAPKGVDFDLDPHVVYDVARGNILGDASQAPGTPIISVHTAKRACGYGETRPYSDSETYVIVYHVEVRGRSVQLVLDDQATAPQTNSRAVYGKH
jgi:hypothetical protein